MPSVLKDRGQLRSKINKHMLIGVSDVRLFTGVEKELARRIQNRRRWGAENGREEGGMRWRPHDARASRQNRRGCGVSLPQVGTHARRRRARKQCMQRPRRGTFYLNTVVPASLSQRIFWSNPLFRCTKNLQDFSLNRIFERMHKILNVDKQNN
jgi:hypothetical protein